MASFIVKLVPEPAGQSDYRPPSDEEMNRELDRAEQQSGDQKTGRQAASPCTARQVA
ncbi:MAG: hypothetical protein Q8L44_03670 [Sulfuritalea sp.]|nr:hypothetical protein [Sulfuritalea sp.]